MNRAAFVCSIFLIVTLSLHGQVSPAPKSEEPPQSARQALLEMFFGESPNHLEKHLPEITKKAFQRLDSESPSFLNELKVIALQARAGGGVLRTMDTGPTLLVAEEPQGREKFEVIVERDDLMGDEDQIDLSFHLYRNGKPEALPFLPRLTFAMKMEAEVWRLNEFSFSARMPLADPDFLKSFVDQLVEKQQRSNEFAAAYSVRMIVLAESEYQASHPDKSFACSLKDLAAGSPPTQEGDGATTRIDEALASGKKNGYVFALTGCDNAHYRVAAEPATAAAGRLAFCSDQSGEIRFSKNGKATTCLSGGEPYIEGLVVD